MLIIRHFLKKKYRENLYEEKVEIKPNLFDEYSENDEKRMEIIGQNGNNGEHYDSDDLNKDGIVDSSDLKAYKDLQNKYPQGSDEWNRIGQEIERLKIDLIEKIYKIFFNLDKSKFGYSFLDCRSYSSFNS